MPSEDITFCWKQDCECVECYRNPKRIKEPTPHSFAIIEGTELCYKTNPTPINRL